MLLQPYVISQVASGQDIGYGLTSIINHRMGKYATSLDKKKAYRQIKVSYKDSMLRLSILFRDPLKREGMVIFRTATCNFGDSQPSLALRVAQDKFIASNCKTKLVKLASEDPFADNYLLAEAIIELIDLHKKVWYATQEPFS